MIQLRSTKFCLCGSYPDRNRTMKVFLTLVLLLLSLTTSISITHGRTYFSDGDGGGGGGGRLNGSDAGAGAGETGEREEDGKGQWVPSSSSLAFVFDTTGSMYDDLVQVIEGAAKILATTLAMRSKPLHNYILVPFHDPEVGPVTVTTDPEQFQQDLRDLYVQGGGDCPEMSITGVKLALQQALPHSFIYVFTDARAKDYDATEEVLGLIQHKQSQVIFVMTGDCGNVSHPGFKAYERIASTSSGQVFLLKKSQVNKILDFVRVAVQSRKVNLLAIDFNRTSTGGEGEGGGGGGGEESTPYDLPVDTKLQEFTISISGKNPTITITDPYGNVLTPDNGLSTLLDLKNALIVNVKHPKPGVWRLRFGADGHSTVRITGLSSLDFVHGFSRNSTLHLSETTPRPIKGIPTFVVINVTDIDGSGRLTKVELVDLYGDLLMEIPVHHDSTRPSLYNTSSFQPPSDFFYLKIVGIDDEGHLFQRTTATAISGTEPQVAEVHLSPLTRGFYDQTALITCQVISSIPFELRWFHGNERLGTSLFYSESANVTWAIADASSSNEGLYTCGVSNVAGESSASTYLDVTDAPPSVTRPENVSVIPGDDAVFHCYAVSSVDFNITWMRHPEEGLGDLESRFSNFPNGTAVIRSVREEDKGRYICRATNEGGSRDQMAWLQVQSEPKAVIESDSMTFMVGAEVRLLCRTFGHPLPASIWMRGGQLVKRSERIDIDDSTGELTITEAEKDDEGSWTCVAENSMGRSNTSIELQRIAPPTISILNRTVLVSTGDTATMRCSAEGIPQPNITWMKNGIQLQELSFLEMHRDGILLISGTQELDAGDYDCVATNDAGSATGTISLQVGSDVVIVERPQSRGVEIAMNATLRCSAVGKPTPTITWKGPDGKDIGWENPRVLIQDNGHLFINGVDREDEGIYVCVARNQLSQQQVSAVISVTGIVKPIIDVTDHNVDAVVTKDVRLSCVVIGGNPTPKVTWSKLGEPISAGEGVIIDDVNGYLLLKKVKVTDGGEYTCVAENIAGNASLIVKLNVQVAASINETVTEYSVGEGHSVQLSCQATGNPKPEITWSKNGVKISDSDLHYLVDGTGALQIFSVDSTDSAVYSCTAVNVAGSREHRISLFVQIPPTIDGEFEDLKVIVNTPVQLSCQVTGRPPPTVSWTKYGQPIDHHGNDSRLELLSNGALRIISASVDDSGLYECFASNPAGNASRLIAVSIQVPPQLLNREPGTMTSIAGQQVVLPCDVIGEPKPVLTWKKNFQVLRVFSGDDKYYVNDNGSLVIPNVSISDAARFLCIAENSVGIEAQEIQLTVNEFPYFPTDLPGEATALANERVVLECPARGTPFPRITWYKDGSALTGNELSVRILGDGSLSLDAAQIEDRATYTCVADNLIGNISRDIELRVYWSPRFENDEFGLDVESAQVIRGQPIRVQCQVTSFPPPMITWHKDGIELSEEDFGDRMVLHEDGKELEIRAAEEEDAGRYKCIANNVAGLAEKMTDVYVWVVPEIDETIASDRNLSVIVTHPFFINCPVIGGIPPPEVTWYKDEKLIVRGQDKGIKVISSGQRLEFDAVDITDAGTYSCEARNPAGFAERQHNLTVLVPPKINGSDSMTSVEVLLNSSTSLRCAISGFPYPEVTWYHGDDVIDDNTSGVHIMASGLGLHIPRVQLGHNGTYTCRAANEAGETSKHETLTVLVVPEIIETQVQHNPSVVLNETAVISCPSSGIPFPDVVWLRNDEAIDVSRHPNMELREKNHQLVIRNVGTVDSATYRCLVMNKAGQDTLDFVLEVVVPANIDRLGHDLYPSVKVSQTRSLLCPVFGIPTPEIIWYKDGDLLTPNTNQYISIQEEGRRLEVTATAVADSGVYQCRVHNDAGEDQLTYHLKVIVPPEIDSENSSPRNPKVTVNATGVIVCSAKGIPHPTISWRVNGQPLDRTDQRYSLSRDGSRLQVYGAQVTDAGRYTCVAKNDAGFAENDFDLEVLVPPYSKTFESERHVTVVKGRTTVLDCPIQGIPFPNVTWTRNGETLTRDSRMTLLYGGRHLELSMAAESDAAKYACTGSNEAGEMTLSFNVTVVVPPELDEANIVDNPRIIVNRTMLLECPVGGVPPPQVTWLKNGEALVPRPGIRFLSNGRQVEIFRTQVTDAARYTCVAKNEAGELRKNYELEVLVPPTIDGAGKTDVIEATEGSTVYLPCSTSGIPEPSVSWLKDGVRLMDGLHSNKREMSGGRQLELRQVTSADEGLYRCQAVNIAGQKLKNYRMRVVQPPKIPDSDWETSLSVVERNPFRLECNASGSPEPQLSWRKDGRTVVSSGHRQILRNGRLLQVTIASANDSGLFVCNASNSAGHQQKTYRVRVLVVPRLNGSQSVETVSVTIGGTVGLRCSVIEGFPDPVVRWHRNGLPLSVQTEPNVRTEEEEEEAGAGGQRLVVFGVQLMDGGVYRCVAANEAGSSSRDFLLNVLVPPSIEASPGTVASLVGSRVSLQCDSSGIPKPEVRWEKDGVGISDRNYVINHSGSLFFAAVKMEDGGDYRCTASNEAGSVSRNVTLSVQVAPVIEDDSAALVKVSIGNPVEMRCNASGIPPPRITWLKGTRVLLDVPGYSIAENGSLSIPSAEHRHIGLYVCIARNNAGTDIGQRRLEVQVPPMIDKQQTLYVVNEEREVLLSCRVSGIPPPVVRWIRDNQTITEDNPHYRVIQSNTLAIPIVRAEDSGIFTCFAENEAGESSIDFHLEVHVPPTIGDDESVITVNEFDRATLPCVASGNPRPQVMWIQDGRAMLVGGGRFFIDETGNLTIENVKTSDAGNYVCSAKSVAGRVSKEFSLKVQVIPRMTQLPTEQEVKVSAAIVLECAADGVPPPIIKWRLNNTQLSPQPLSINGHSRLMIGNAQKHHEGTYMCIAENSAGTVRALAAVLVRVPPKVQMLDEVQSVSRSERIVLDCPVVGGDPPPSIVWTKHGSEISLGERIHQLSNGSLVIYDVTSEDGGDYRCVATNDAGSSEGVAHVNVKTPPVFLVRPESQTVEQGQTVMMHCSVTGEPQPVISWNKDGVTLQTEERFTILSNNSLRIVATQMNDSGAYKCIARNFEGKLVSAELTVQVKGQWSSWSSWSQCSVSCGLGTRDRRRRCNHPEPMNGGKNCSGPESETKSCKSIDCPVDGGWSEWSPWNDCSRSCGQGQMSRSRECNNPLPVHGGRYCYGDSMQTDGCQSRPCPIDGNWGGWAPWKPCSEKCGGGIQERFRRCNSPQPDNGGNGCLGNDSERRPCHVTDCEVHGAWGSWSDWSSCAVSCGGGETVRRRICNSPSPENGGRLCLGPDSQTQPCNDDDCPVQSEWMDWAEWGSCTVSCGGGQRRRFRACTDPTSNRMGRPCIGSAQETESCNINSCSVDGTWGSWSQWSDCSKSCGSGLQRRHRSCQGPTFGGNTCPGSAMETRNCNSYPCQAGFPRYSVSNVFGNINNVDLGLSRIFTTINRTNRGSVVSATVINVTSVTSSHLEQLVSLMNPVHWTAASEMDEAINGYSLTKGSFRTEVHFEFASGQTLQMVHQSRGLDNDGVLQVDTFANGEVPGVADGANVIQMPFDEDYIQTGPGHIYGQSSRVFLVSGHNLPYATNHSISYNPEFGSMPYLVQKMKVTDLQMTFNISQKTLTYQATTAMAKGEPSNSCPPGFGLDPKDPYCKDVDECVTLSPCSHICQNTAGSFKCSCPVGLSLFSDGRTCRDINECEARDPHCPLSLDCVNSVGSFRCLAKCESGHRRSAISLLCDDVNECSESVSLCHHECVNVPGSYICACKRGFRPIGRSRCEDINECKEGIHRCSDICRNTLGGYRCDCPDGYALDGGQFTCVDVDECSGRLSDCPPGLKCRNLDGGYECISSCPNGFKQLTNGTCIDVDECAGNGLQCRYNQLCVNTVGSFSCGCPRGFRSGGPHMPCIDIDECNRHVHCQHKCSNTVGSFQCNCPRGYRLMGNGRTCEDIDECSESANDCGLDKKCFNRRGDFECVDISCPQGYERDPDESGSRTACRATNDKDALEFHLIALPSGIRAHQDLIRLLVYNQDNVHVIQSTFSLMNDDDADADHPPFTIRLEDGKGIIQTLKPLEDRASYHLKVEGKSYDNYGHNVLYHTTFVVYISVSSYPY